MAKEQVNHPSHYNQHPAGIECIDVIRHYPCDIANALKYLWRAGLKAEMGKEDADKEIEDLKKALWYIEDYQNSHGEHFVAESSPELMEDLIHKVTGHTITEITSGYSALVSLAMFDLLQVGLIVQDVAYAVYGWADVLENSKKCIRKRIADIALQCMKDEVKETEQILSGQLVEGKDYARPGGERENEPDSYDPLNVIIRNGEAFCLSDETRQKKNGAMYSPCELCDLRRECDEAGTNSPCELLYAHKNQYCRKVGFVKYSPHFGTIEVVDETKEMKMENERLKKGE
jgi:hypothetical protein